MRRSEDMGCRRRSHSPSPRDRRDGSRSRHSYRQESQSHRSSGPRRGSGPRDRPSGTNSSFHPLGHLGTTSHEQNCSIKLCSLKFGLRPYDCTQPEEMGCFQPASSASRSPVTWGRSSQSGQVSSVRSEFGPRIGSPGSNAALIPLGHLGTLSPH